MTEPNWQRVEPDKHAWLRERAAEAVRDGDPDHGRWDRYYVPANKGQRQWPLLVLTVLPRWHTEEEKKLARHRVTVCGSIKRGRDDWFNDHYGIPAVLLDDVTEMFATFIKDAKAGK